MRIPESLPRKNDKDGRTVGKCDLQAKLEIKVLVQFSKGAAWRGHDSHLISSKFSHKDDNQLCGKSPKDSRCGWLALQQWRLRSDLKGICQRQMCSQATQRVSLSLEVSSPTAG